MKRRVLRLLERVGLIGYTFRAYEYAVALRHARVRRVDGPPLPPRRLMVRVAGTADPDWFLRSGRAGYDAIVAKVELAEADAVLDFGCGCGRVTRYWAGQTRPVSGSDVSDDAIAWCRTHLGFARFETNGLAPPTAFDDESFDLVYALSVFTHFTAELQTAWRDELRRVLRPGGRLLITTHGRSYLPRLDPAEREAFDSGRLVVRWANLPGSNLCSAYHPEEYLRETLAHGFELVDLEEEGARGNPTQDLVVLQKLSG